MEENQHLDRILAFEEGTLSADERRQFERDLQQDLSLQNAYASYKDAASFSELLAYQKMREQLQEMQPAKAKRIPIRRIMAIAASIILLGLASGWIFLQNRYSDSALAQRYYIESPIPTEVRSDDTSIESILQEANQAFIQKNYQEVVRVIGDNPVDLRLLMLLGQSNLQLQNGVRALESFQTVIDAGNSPYKEGAEWLIIVAALQGSQDTVAASYLSRILEKPSHGYYQDALNLEQDLRHMSRLFLF